MGIESAIANLATNMSLSSAQDVVSIKMLDKLLDSEIQAAASVISDLKGMPSAGADDLGGLLDVRG